MVQSSISLPDCPQDRSVVWPPRRGCTGSPLARTEASQGLERPKKPVPESLTARLPLPPVRSAPVGVEPGEGDPCRTSGAGLPTAGTPRDVLSRCSVIRPAQRLGWCRVNGEDRE